MDRVHARGLTQDSVHPERSEAKSKDGDERVIACAACHHRLTDAAARIEVDGAHVHTRENPHGYVFTFGCYFAAPGCTGRGEITHAHTWFAGCSWQLDCCGGCGEHLGWLFRGDEHSFHALIVDRIVELSARTDS